LVTTYPLSDLEAASTERDTPLFFLLEYLSIYLDFGDTKIIPRISGADLTSLVAPYPALSAKLASVADALYSTAVSLRTLGWPPKSVTSYSDPPDFTQEEQQSVDALLAQTHISVNNTVIVRDPDRSNVRTQSIAIDDMGLPIGTLNGLPVTVTNGFQSGALSNVNRWVTRARDAALSSIEAEALESLLSHLANGDIADHIRYSEQWVHDSAPTIESYLGVIESYRDPSGRHCEWEDFVAALDQTESRFLHDFVAQSAVILLLLPYSRVYERATFVPPSYNAINILTFCVSGMPVGINIPNYDDVRLTGSFKKVSLSNVFAQSAPLHFHFHFHFLTDADFPGFLADYADARKFGIAAHELSGHWSGTLFLRADIEGGIRDLLDPELFVGTASADEETFQSVFGDIVPSYEECRAETTSLHLTYRDEVLELFGIAAERRARFKVNSTLVMLHNRLVGFPNFATDVAMWKQLHARARFGILRAVIRLGGGAVAVRRAGEQFKIEIDSGKFGCVVEAIAKLLKHLNYYKAVRLPEQARVFFDELTSLDDFWIQVRAHACEIHLPRTVIVGATVVRDEEDVRLVGTVKEKLTPLDVVLWIVQNIRIAAE
jgi:dipeptidyl-peptidase-3